MTWTIKETGDDYVENEVLLTDGKKTFRLDGIVAVELRDLLNKPEKKPEKKKAP